MDVVSACPLYVASTVWQSSPSGWMLMFICKATYALAPGESGLAEEQEAPNEHDDHWNDDPNRSVRAPCDLVPVKLRPEVMLVGHAFAPMAAPARALTARLLVGDIDKSIEVFCDRTFTLDGQLQEGARFQRMPLIYERAAGGPGTMNPVGVRNDARDPYGRRALPNLQPLGSYVASSDVFIEPVGFGPIAASWPSRVERLGHHASWFVESSWRSRPLPDGFDLHYFSQAPPDQTLTSLRDNERIVLENLHPEHARLVTSLCGIKPVPFVDRGRGAPQRLAMHADTLWIDTDRRIATLTWRSQIQLTQPDEAGRVVVGMERSGQELAWADVAWATRQARGGAASVHEVAQENTAEVDVEELGGHLLSEDMPTATGISEPAASALPFAYDQARAEKDGRQAMRPGAGLPFQAAPPLPASAPLPPTAWPKAPPLPATPASPQRSFEPQPPSKPATPFAPAAPPVPPAPAPIAPAPPPLVMPQPVPAAPRPAPVDSPWAAGAPPTTSMPSPGSLSGMSGAAGVALASSSSLSAASAASSPAPSVDEAARRGGSAASGAGVEPGARFSPPQRDLRALRASAGEAEPEAAKVEPARERLSLIWFDPACMPRVRRIQAWKPVLVELQGKPIDRESDDAGGDKEPEELEDRREARAVLARGVRSDAKGVEDAAERATQDDGTFVPPLLLLAADIELPFDELEALKATVTTASPLITPTDEALMASVTVAKEFLQQPGLLAAPSVSEGLATRIREAFLREKRALAPDYLDAQVERVLLAGRHYQKREVFGASYLRLLATPADAQSPLIGYLPADLAKKLPMFKRFRARFIAEVHPAQDQYETQPLSLRLLALARAGAASPAPAPTGPTAAAKGSA